MSLIPEMTGLCVWWFVLVATNERYLIKCKDTDDYERSGILLAELSIEGVIRELQILHATSSNILLAMFQRV